MLLKKYFALFLVAQLVSLSVAAQKNSFPVVTGDVKASIFYNKNAPALDSITANLLADDIERVTLYKPNVITDLSQAKGYVIMIGQIQSVSIQQFTSKKFRDNLQGKWECFGYTIVNSPTPLITKAFIIAGSDARGTAYGVFSLSEKIGVSPWYWWADVAVQKKNELLITQDDFISAPPSVKYRGIFINDEDWGLLPWASNTFEPEVKNIGPKTYAKVFELLLRLKANIIWPAMHPGTTPFYNVPGNAETAKAYSIVVGTSHAEPMLRNNVGEWDEKTMGRFNYTTNKDKVHQYWEERVRQSKGNEVVFTLGMRGVHDSGMEGVKTPKDAVPLLEQIFKDQRDLIKKHIDDDPARVPQVFTAYKEVLDIYDQGLKLPDDVTIVWPDDNYGYIQRLNSDAERKRAGGSGVYYHASYWGRPHDYLWLGTTHPSLIRHEMMKAYEAGADRLWVLNVGDIKAIEYSMQLFLDMAYRAAPFENSEYTKMHLQQWCRNIFGDRMSGPISQTLWKYYDLAFERRPEFMGWSQTEPTTNTNYTSYNHFYFGDEAQRRIDAYETLQRSASLLRNLVHHEQANAFYQLIYYPVLGASWMNKKFLYRDKVYLYAMQNRISAYDYAIMSRSVYDSIIIETKYYNERLTGGKWNGMMSMKPRDLPVFHPPVLPVFNTRHTGSWDAVPEGYDSIAYAQNAEKKLPLFRAPSQQTYFIDVFLTDSVEMAYTTKTSAGWIRIRDEHNGQLLPVRHKNSSRILVSIDWTKFPAPEYAKGFIEIMAGGKTISISLDASRPRISKNFSGSIESDGYISIPAENFASYKFYSYSSDTPRISVHTLPGHPLTKDVSMRYGVSIDEGPMQVVDARTFGRSEEWKQNMLRNSAVRTLKFPPLTKGFHTVKIHAIDPGVILNWIYINFNNRHKYYSAVSPTHN